MKVRAEIDFDLIDYLDIDDFGGNKYLIGCGFIHNNSHIVLDNGDQFPIKKDTRAIHFEDMIDSSNNPIFASLSEEGKGGDIFKHSINCRLDSPRPHDGTYWISCESPLVYKDFGFYFKYHIVDSTPKYADGKITNRKGLARFEKNLEFIGIKQ